MVRGPSLCSVLMNLKLVGGFQTGVPGDESFAGGSGSFSRLKLHQDDWLFPPAISRAHPYPIHFQQSISPSGNFGVSG